jgi:GDP-L-fucose synthase
MILLQVELNNAKEKGLKEVHLWGTGMPKREFIYVDDMAEALVFLMNTQSQYDIVNVGTGKDVSIKVLAELVKDAVGWDGVFKFNGVMDGMLEKRLSVQRINMMGWEAKTELTDGIKLTLNNIYENNLHKNW